MNLDGRAIATRPCGRVVRWLRDVNNADYLHWDAFAHALAAHVRRRNGPDLDRRIAERERKLMIAP